MQIRHASHPDDVAALSKAALRERFVADALFVPGEQVLVYTHEDRMVIGGVMPIPGAPIELEAPAALRSERFCDRRELAVVQIGTAGTVTVDGVEYALEHRDVLYVGQGSRSITFGATSAGEAAFYLASALSFSGHPTTLVRLQDALTTRTGDAATANRRTVHKHIHADGVRSDQLVLGITSLEPGSVWNSMPPHTHDRRTEIYLYFGLPEGHRVQHVMGEPDDTRTLVLSDRDAVISPSWSVHFGSGTTDYAFVWVMAGENQAFTDMDQVAVTALA
ncbi:MULTISPECIES: 5-dehydro-4-deoxy-D-glucuronate isomerase [Agromyces]|uniref:5-dehydro-4-deoxy-D-glucuronate isomerase n=1 Tax=Agromyces kandeliae TaxID=2666141 RepID=A0A6L5R3P5_9MICO|nr:5-dehydro-4-deoxy-D-glucuronate isomerase [Agromyces kandeliae]MRX44633.1 5-dehydro-4-deoxy-D-glucuronate isomerase [Agromyces kandeliae]